MKKIILFFAMVGIAAGGMGASATSSGLAGKELTSIHRALHQSADTMNLIDWKVGEYANFNISSPFGSGEMKKWVNSEEGEAIWVHSEISMAGQTQTAQLKISRVTGEILEYIENGQKKAPPSQDGTEIIEQTEEQVTVPAGTFDSIRIKIRTADGKNLETWINPSQVTMEGTIKTIVKTFITLTMELTTFGSP